MEEGYYGKRIAKCGDVFKMAEENRIAKVPSNYTTKNQARLYRF